MPNQWGDAANSSNQFDKVGYIYSNITTTPMGCCIDKLYPTSGFSMSDFWDSFPHNGLEEMKYNASNYYREAIYQAVIQIAIAAKNKIVGLIDILDNSSSVTDFQVLKQTIITWEQEVQSAPFSSEDKAKLLCASSVARYGALIGMTKESQLTNNSLARSFWSWVGAVVGAVVAILLGPIIAGGALTVGGMIIFGGLGAWGGYELVEAILALD